MRLLVSVRSAVEAAAALDGGADLIDAKDPTRGALGAVTMDVLRQIHRTAGHARPISAALGDAGDEASVETQTRDFAASGAAFVKVGFLGVTSPRRVESLLAAALRGSRDVIAVGYADATDCLTPAALIDVSARAGARGVLLDTADKRGPGLTALIPPAALAAWVQRARAAGLLVAVAGQLSADDLSWVRDSGADIAGVRGAACTGGRNGSVSAEHVRRLIIRARKADL